MEFFLGSLSIRTYWVNDWLFSTKQSTLDIVHIYNMHIEADHSHSEVKDSTLYHNEPDQPCGGISINGIESVYNKPNVLIVLKDAQAVFQ